MARRQTAVFGLFAAAGLALYLWPALTAPVVEWSDSAIDLAWARQGLGIFRPVWTLGHAAKPGYLLFLRGALGLSGGSVRGIVVLQSLVVWGSIGLSALLLARRRGAASGITFCALMFAFLRLRDASSAMMSEPISSALFLPVAVALLDPPVRYRSLALLGLAEGALFLVRPNLGVVALLMTAVRLAWVGRWRALAVAAVPAILLVLPFWIATSPGLAGDRARGLTFQMFEASADDYWLPSLAPAPSLGAPAEISRELGERARANWKRTLSSRGPDARRQLLWRSLHGLFGTEFYDARWSSAYRALTTASRLVTPFALLAAIALILAAPLGGDSLAPKVLGLLVLAIVVGQDLVLGSNPRYILPFLPVLLLFALCALPVVVRCGAPRMVAALVVFAVVTGLVATHRSVLGCEWGLIESAGVSIEQPIPKRSLPKGAPATLHVRIAPPLLPTSAGLEIRAGSQLLYSSESDGSRQRPEVTMSLPQALLDANGRGPLALQLRSTGTYDSTHYLLFPVIPPPWAPAARRDGSPELSPASGIARGALDWWAHDGNDTEPGTRR